MVNEVHKPRRTRGTPLYRTRRYFALGVLGVSIISGLLFHNFEGAKILRKRIEDMLSESAEETRFKREIMKNFIIIRPKDDSD